MTQNSDGESVVVFSHVGFAGLQEHLRRTFNDPIPETRNTAESVNQGLNTANQILVDQVNRLKSLLAEAQQQLEALAAKKKAPRRRR